MPNMPSTATVPLPRLVVSKKKARSQIYKIRTLEGRAIFREIPVTFSCADDSRSGHAFLVDPDNQYESKRGERVQLAGESSAIPIMERVKREDEVLDEIMNKIYCDSDEEVILNQFKLAHKSAFMDKLLWLVGIPTCGFVLLYGLHLLKH